MQRKSQSPGSKVGQTTAGVRRRPQQRGSAPCGEGRCRGGCQLPPRCPGTAEITNNANTTCGCYLSSAYTPSSPFCRNLIFYNRGWKLQLGGQIWPTTCFYKQTYTGIATLSCTAYGCFCLQRQTSVVATETIRLASRKHYLSDPSERVC